MSTTRQATPSPRFRRLGSVLAFAAILTISGCNGEPIEERETLRLVILTGGETNPTAVTATLDRVTSRKAEVTRLFPDVDPDDDPDALAQMFVAVIIARLIALHITHKKEQ